MKLASVNTQSCAPAIFSSNAVIGVSVFGIESNRFIQFADRHGCFTGLFVRVGHHHPSGDCLTGQTATAQFADFRPVLSVIGTLADDLVAAFRHLSSYTTVPTSDSLPAALL